MNWKKLAQIQIIITVILLVCVVLRLGLIIEPVAGCCGFESPDGVYMASALNLVDEDFWGNTREYYEFSVENKNGELIEGVRLETKIIKPQIQMGYAAKEKIIIWSSDSTEVTFDLQNIELKLKVNKNTETEEDSHKS
jgi:hypothetical protein